MLIEQMGRMNKMKKLIDYFIKLIQVNSGHSSKAFFLVSVTLIGSLMLLSVVFILVWEVITYGTIKTDLMGLSAFVGSISTLFVSAGLTKTIGERGEIKQELKTE